MITQLLFPFEHFGAAHLATVVIGLVCAYLGTFLVMRRTVFVGITIGELAALGIAAAFWSFLFIGDQSAGGRIWHEHGAVAGALLFGIAGAMVFGGSRGDSRLSSDARLGVGYAAAAGFALILVSGTAQGLEELKNVLAGSVLFVSGARLGLIALVLGLIAAVHVAFRKELLFASFDPDMARTVGLPAGVYEKVLNLSIGIAIAVAIQSAGLLLVFGFLVLPALAGFALAPRLRGATLVALGAALVGSTAGLGLSAGRDWPIGPGVVASLCCLLAVAYAASRRPELARVVRGLLASAVVLCLIPLMVAFGSTVFGTHFFEPRTLHELHATHAHADEVGVAADAVAGHRAQPGPLPDVADLRASLREAPRPRVRADAARFLGRLRAKEAYPDLAAALGDPDETVREAAVDALGDLGDERAVPHLRELAASAGDETVTLHVGLALLHIGEPEGARLLVELLEQALFPFTRDEALGALVAVAGDGDARGYDPDRDAEQNAAAIAAWRAWWQQHGPRLDAKAMARPFEEKR